MPTVNEILLNKGTLVHCIEPTATVLDAIARMNDNHIGALVVTEETRVAGMFTERDVLRQVVAKERPPAEVLVSEVMSTRVTCCEPEMPIDEARGVMKNLRIRHLPVVNKAGDLQGLISIGDLNAFHLNGQEATIHMLHEYLYGRT